MTKERKFSELDLSSIKDHLILLDIDGTIVCDGDNFLDAGTRQKIAELAGENKVYLCSNKKNAARNNALAASAGVFYTDTNIRKPSKQVLDSVKDVDNNQSLIVIGDKYLTDGFFAKNIGAKFIRVGRIKCDSESAVNRILYFIDDILSVFINSIKKLFSYFEANEKVFSYLLIFLILSWVLGIGWLKYDLYKSFILTSDAALYPNILWNTDLKEIFLYNRIYFDWYGYKTFLSEHFAPTLFLIVPIYKLLPHPLSLVFLQTIVAGFTAILVYFLGRQLLLKKSISFLAAFVYLLHPSLISATIDNVYGFHHDVLILPLAIATAIFFFKQKIIPFVISIFLLFGLKENIPLAGLLLAFELLLFKRSRKFGLAVAVLSVLFILSGLFLVPYISGLRNHHAADILQLISSFSFNDLFAHVKAMFYWLILFLFLPAIFAPEVLVLAVPDISMYFFAQKLPFYHHVFLSFAIFIVAFAIGLSRVMNNQGVVFAKSKKIIKLTLPFLILFFIIGNLFVFKKHADLKNKFSWRNIDMVFVERVKNIVPYKSCLVATSDLAIYFTNRPCLSWSEKSLGAADFILVNKNAAFGFDYDKNFIEAANKLRDSGIIFSIAEKNDMILYRKK